MNASAQPWVSSKVTSNVAHPGWKWHSAPQGSQQAPQAPPTPLSVASQLSQPLRGILAGVAAGTKANAFQGQLPGTARSQSFSSQQTPMGAPSYSLHPQPVGTTQPVHQLNQQTHPTLRAALQTLQGELPFGGESAADLTAQGDLSSASSIHMHTFEHGLASGGIPARSTGTSAGMPGAFQVPIWPSASTCSGGAVPAEDMAHTLNLPNACATGAASNADALQPHHPHKAGTRAPGGH